LIPKAVAGRLRTFQPPARTSFTGPPGRPEEDVLPKKHISTTHAPKPIGPYSQGVISGGLLFASGQIAIDPKTGELVKGEIEAQTEQALKNLIAILKEAKMGPENVVKATVYLSDFADFPKMNEVYTKFLGKEPPARTTIQAAGLPRGVKVEIDIIAAF
jgi:2-iminobutanoate/2-iminopropanoate deaminase